MSDKISLEHIIRNIAEGKFTPSDEQKVTLEHTIKNVMVDEGVKVKDAKRGYDFISGLWKKAENGNLPAVVSKEKEVVGHKPNLPAKPKTAEVPAKAPETTVEPKAEVKPEVKPETKVKTDVKLNKPTVTATDTATPTKTPTDTETKVVPKAVIVPNIATAPQEEPSKKVAPPVPPQEPDGKKAAETIKAPKGYVGRGKPIPHFYGYDVLHRVPTNRHLSFARPAIKEENERKKIENVPRPDAGDRHDLEYVGRKKKDTLARNASVKNVVNEGKKLANVVKSAVKDQNKSDKTKVLDKPPIIINPNLNHPDLNVAEGVVKTTGKVINHAFNGLGAYQAVDSARKGDMTGAAVGAGMLIPNPIGSAVAASSIAGDIATGTETGRKVGKWIGDNVPGAKAAAEKAKELRAKVGLGSTASKPDEDEVKPLAPGEGIKLQPKKPK